MIRVDPSSIKVIIFDLGGVLLDIDYTLMYRDFSRLTGLSEEEIKCDPFWIDLVGNFETGKISSENFIWNIQQKALFPKPQGLEVIRAWNSMLIGWNSEKFEFLLKLKKHYSLFLLSNINELHLQWVHRDLTNNHGISDFESRFFDGVVYSHIAGLRKPDQAIFQYINERYNLESETLLFIDDMTVNVNAASIFGWNTYLHDPTQDLIGTISDWLS